MGDDFHETEDKCGTLSQDAIKKKTFCWAGFLSDSSGLFELAFRNPIYTVLKIRKSGSKASAAKSAGVDMSSVSTWRPWLESVKGRGAARALSRAAARWPKM